MKRPIGVMVLAVLAFVEGVYHSYEALVYLGIAPIFYGPTGTPHFYNGAQWTGALFAGLGAAIAFGVTYGLWNLRLWAWIYTVFMASYVLLWSSFAVLGAAPIELMAWPMLLSVIILLYCFYPPIRETFFSDFDRTAGLK